MMGLRDVARDIALRILSAGRRIDSSGGWVRMPFYHGICDEDQSAFAGQLDYMRQFGEFISITEALELIQGRVPIDGRYFSLSFDDGFKSCATNAFPILAGRSIPATFYIVSDLVDRSLAPGDVIARNVFGYTGRDNLEFLSWEDCRMLAENGMTIGSHTASHARLAASDVDQVEAELTRSRRTIEREVGHPCLHFCAPYGVPGRDFLPDRDTQLASDAGYISFATATRGPNLSHGNALALTRDHIEPTRGLHQLRYFLSN